MVLTVVREKLMSKVPGGYSSLTAALLTEFVFNTTNGNDLSTSGIFFKLHGHEEPTAKPLLAKIGCLRSDEPALKELSLCKGHSGFKPCLLCSNVLLRKYYKEDIHGQDHVPHSCIDFTKFVLHTDDSIRASLRQLEEKRDCLPSTTYAELEKVIGFRHMSTSLLALPFINVASSVMFDWMHCYLAGGLVDVELGELMVACKAAGAPWDYQILCEYLLCWRWPSAVLSPNILKLFNPKAAAAYLKSASFSAQSNEMLSLAPVLAHFLVVVATPLGSCVGHVKSLLAALDVLDLFQTLKTTRVDP